MKKFWSSAREMYERSWEILIELRQRNVLTADELDAIDELSHKIAECDLFLSK